MCAGERWGGKQGAQCPWVCACGCVRVRCSVCLLSTWAACALLSLFAQHVGLARARRPERDSNEPCVRGPGGFSRLPVQALI